MTILTPKPVKEVAAAWRRQYFEGGKWGSTIDGSSRKVYDALKALPDDATTEQIEAVVSGWATYLCSECHEYKKFAVDLGYSDEEATVCLECLQQALTKLEAEASR